MRPSARALARVTVLAILVAVSGWLLWPTQLGGHTAYVTTQGTSMEPSFHTGDLAVLRTADHYDVGDVVAYHSTLLHTVVMHRIVAIEGGHYTFKGDNNAWLDPEQPTAADLIGRLSLRVPQGGSWFARLASPPALGLIAFGLLASGGTTVQMRRRRKRGTMSRPTTTGTNRSKELALATAPPWLRTAAAATAVVAMLGLALAAWAWTGPVTTPATSQGQAEQSMAFSYTASVPQTPAYDGTSVFSPDPVFRRLASIVDVSFAYQGAPGTVTVSAKLSTASGWHSTVPLAAPTTFTTTSYKGTVGLDLKALDARAQAAAAVTGLPTNELTVTVLASVDTSDGARFAPTLSLNLSPLQLTLAGDAKALVVRDSTNVKQVTTAPRTIGALGQQLTAATARALSTILLLAGLLGAAILALVTRLSAPTSEAAGIRRRYAPLLVPVQPMPAPSGRPVIDVTEFATLARLAERYGLLVLHWTRTNVATFVVQDQGTTYRYRTSTGTIPDPDTGSAPVEAAINHADL
jgi:signal peptidase I